MSNENKVMRQFQLSHLYFAKAVELGHFSVLSDFCKTLGSPEILAAQVKKQY